MDEQWKDVVGWENFYEVSNLGSIRSKKRKVKTSFGIAEKGGKVLKPIFHKTNKYMIVNLSTATERKTELVHRIVLMAFVGFPRDGFEACHNNGVRSDNRLENLRWDTKKNNHADKLIHGTAQRGHKNGNAKVSLEVAKLVKFGTEPLKKIANQYQLKIKTLGNIRYGQTWKHLQNV